MYDSDDDWDWEDFHSRCCRNLSYPAMASSASPTEGLLGVTEAPTPAPIADTSDGSTVGATAAKPV